MASINSLLFDRSIVDGWFKADDKDNRLRWMDSPVPRDAGRWLIVEFDRARTPIPSSMLLPNMELAIKQRVEASNQAGIVVLLCDCLTTKNGLKFLRYIEKKPMTPSGMAYVLTLTLLDQAHFRMTMTCLEKGTTGLRDSSILNEVIQSGQLKLDPTTDDWGGWLVDPHGYGKQAPLMQNLSEEEKYDERFPDHPLSQLRRFMKLLDQSLDFDQDQTWTASSSPSANWLGKIFGKK